MKLTDQDLKAIKNLMELTIEEKGVTKQEFKEKISHLPTKEEYYKREDETMKELKAIREEQAAHSVIHEDLDKRLHKVEKQLQM